MLCEGQSFRHVDTQERETVVYVSVDLTLGVYQVVASDDWGLVALYIQKDENTLICLSHAQEGQRTVIEVIG